MSDKIRAMPGTEGMAPIRQPIVAPELEAPLETEEGVLLANSGRMAFDKALRCKHGHVRVTLDHRIFCKDCEHYVDPVSFIKAQAREWDGVLRKRRQATDELRRLETIVAELKREEERAKARVKRVEPSDIKVMRVALTKAGQTFSRIEEALSALGIEDQDDPICRKLWEARSLFDAAAKALRPELRLARIEESA